MEYFAGLDLYESPRSAKRALKRFLRQATKIGTAFDSWYPPNNLVKQTSYSYALYRCAYCECVY